MGGVSSEGSRRSAATPFGLGSAHHIELLSSSLKPPTDEGGACSIRAAEQNRRQSDTFWDQTPSLMLFPATSHP
jgi:hypothetical protein